LTKERSILLLRHWQAADRTEVRLAKFGYPSTKLPLSEIRLSPYLLPSGQYNGVILTSSIAAHALQNMEAVSHLKNLPVFCVGQYTAKTAKAAGFTQISAIENDANALAAILGQLTPEHKLLYPCAKHTSFDFAAHLAGSGISCRNWQIYSNGLISPDGTQINKALQLTDTVFLYSKRTASHFFKLAQRTKLIEQGCDRHAFVAISSQVGQTVPRKFQANTYIANEKNDHGMIECVSTIG